MKPTYFNLLRAHRPLSRMNKVKPLVPPLQLYKKILRQHKYLPSLQRELGDQYVKNEFKLHKQSENPLHIVGFLTSWQDYLHTISDGKWVEGSLSKDILNKMSNEQIGQLYELMKESESLKQGTVTNSSSTTHGH